MEYDVAVIGGGPAGMMAAGRAAQCGARTILVEKNRSLGKKLLITGNGRCNITNAEPDIQKFLRAFGRRGRFLFPALKTFNTVDTVDFFNRRGLENKIEEGGRVFPRMDNSRDVLDVMTDFLKEQGVAISCGTKINGLVQTNSMLHMEIEASDMLEETKFPLTLGERQSPPADDAGNLWFPEQWAESYSANITADRYILCTGGSSYPGTGSTGEGMSWAKNVGHNMIRPRQALVPLCASDNWIRELKGLSLQGVDISAFQNGKKKQGTRGDMLFTDNGVTGPAILDMSKSIGERLGEGAVELRIDLRPELDHPQLDALLQEELRLHSKKDVRNVLAGIIPARLTAAILTITGIDTSKNAGNVSKEERKMIVHTMKQLALHINSLGGFEKAMVTAGGVDLKEIFPDTLQSRIVENLHFAGEILDIDGPTGGYNLQAAWSTGYLAGESAAKKIPSRKG
ncbi:MAG: NAD(P)/FAD-dependent oxidoreductase [Thermoplasmata archaeon]|nr:NAD(P)/FAD-dependent oxidoreductase [Thermoplasmata archaeon]